MLTYQAECVIIMTVGANPTHDFFHPFIFGKERATVMALSFLFLNLAEYCSKTPELFFFKNLLTYQAECVIILIVGTVLRPLCFLVIEGKRENYGHSFLFFLFFF